jgi:hypothetical protein
MPPQLLLLLLLGLVGAAVPGIAGSHLSPLQFHGAAGIDIKKK